MTTLDDFVNDVTPREREVLAAELGPGEQVRWATRPVVHRGLLETVMHLGFQLLGLVMLMAASAELTLLSIRWAEFRCSTIAFLLFCALCLLVSAMGGMVIPVLKKNWRRHTLYVLTNHRAIVQKPGRWNGWVLLTFPLREHMLRTRVCRPGGGGDLLFSVSREGYPAGDLGFTWLPNLGEAQQQLNASINALLDAAECRPGAANIRPVSE